MPSGRWMGVGHWRGGLHTSPLSSLHLPISPFRAHRHFVLGMPHAVYICLCGTVLEKEKSLPRLPLVPGAPWYLTGRLTCPPHRLCHLIHLPLAPPQRTSLRLQAYTSRQMNMTGAFEWYGLSQAGRWRQKAGSENHHLHVSLTRMACCQNTTYFCLLSLHTHCCHTTLQMSCAWYTYLPDWPYS